MVRRITLLIPGLVKFIHPRLPLRVVEVIGAILAHLLIKFFHNLLAVKQLDYMGLGRLYSFLCSVETTDPTLAFNCQTVGVGRVGVEHSRI